MPSVRNCRFGDLHQVCVAALVLRAAPVGSSETNPAGIACGVLEPYPSRAAAAESAIGYRMPLSVTTEIVPVPVGAVAEAAERTSTPCPDGTLTRSAPA